MTPILTPYRAEISLMNCSIFSWDALRMVSETAA